MIIFSDGTVIDHCFCYQTKGKTCSKKNCTGKDKKIYSYKIKPTEKTK